MDGVEEEKIADSQVQLEFMITKYSNKWEQDGAGFDMAEFRDLQQRLVSKLIEDRSNDMMVAVAEA